MANKKTNKVIIHKYDDEYLTEMHLAKTILKAYGIDLVIVERERPMHHKTMYHITGRSNSTYLVSSFMCSLAHLKKGK